MKAQLEAIGYSDVSLVASGGGVFEITIDGDLQFSKKQLGRFPTDDEVAKLAG